jgi:hypothetical protein
MKGEAQIIKMEQVREDDDDLDAGGSDVVQSAAPAYRTVVGTL